MKRALLLVLLALQLNAVAASHGPVFGLATPRTDKIIERVEKRRVPAPGRFPLLSHPQVPTA